MMIDGVKSVQNEIVVSEHVVAVAQSGGAEHECVAHVGIGLIHLARVDRQADARVLTAHLAIHLQEAARVAFVVVLATGHVDAHPGVPVTRDPVISLLHPLHGIRGESEHHELQAQRDPGSSGIGLG
jgi:hypothetical protein